MALYLIQLQESLIGFQQESMNLHWFGLLKCFPIRIAYIYVALLGHIVSPDSLVETYCFDAFTEMMPDVDGSQNTITCCTKECSEIVLKATHWCINQAQCNKEYFGLV